MSNRKEQCDKKADVWSLSDLGVINDSSVHTQLCKCLQEHIPKAIQIELIADKAKLSTLALWLDEYLPDIPRVIDITPLSLQGEKHAVALEAYLS